MDSKEIETKLFKESPVDADLKLEFLDLPKLHCYGNKSATAFFDALANTDSIDLFANRGIQTIIDYKWKLVKEYTLKKLFAPFMVYMIAFFLYSNFVFVQRFFETDQEAESLSTYDYFFYILAPLNLALSIYFFVSEFR